jgi:hypothetical protein
MAKPLPMNAEEHRALALGSLMAYPPLPVPEMEICRLLEGLIHAVLSINADNNYSVKLR